MTEYIVLCGQVVGGNGRPFETVYGFDGKKFSDRESAIRHGRKVRGSDDFNIGVLTHGRLVSLDWMNTPVDTDPNVLGPIADHLCL